MSIMMRTAAVAATAALALGACGGGDDDTDDAEGAGAPTTTVADGDAGGGSSAEQQPGERPDVTLEPVSEEWTEACETSDEMVDLAWRLSNGGGADPNGIAALMLGLLEQVPQGAADDEIAYVNELIAAFVADEDLDGYRPDFQDNVDMLLRAVGEGCGIAADEPLPLPGGMLDNLEDVLFGA
jgi:hypothetical protein